MKSGESRLKNHTGVLNFQLAACDGASQIALTAGANLKFALSRRTGRSVIGISGHIQRKRLFYWDRDNI